MRLSDFTPVSYHNYNDKTRGASVYYALSASNSSDRERADPTRATAEPTVAQFLENITITLD